MIYKHIEHIAAGQFIAQKTSHSIYQAYLGTCVGLALFDHKTKIGGLIHILLPEPPTLSSGFYPEKYASSGIPMLIKAMLDLGATLENMEASIAGGALVGPVSQQDINLDIGGRTTDITVAILDSAGIKIIQSETGGFFTCTLELDMTTGLSTIKPAWEVSHQVSMKFSPPSIDDISETIEQLKPIPQTALKIFRMFKSGTGDITDIARELGKDQVLSGQTLKICNSVLFSGTSRIESLKDAILLLGEEQLLSSVITAAVNTYFDQTGTSGYSLCRGGLFFHAVGVAALSRKIAEKKAPALANNAFTAGLLHDIGKVILDQFVAESAPLFFRQMNDDQYDFLDLEKKMIGVTHCEAGLLLAKRWKFSDSLTDVIGFHHTPEKAVKDKTLVTIVYLADLLTEHFNAGFDLDKIQVDSFQNAMNSLGLTHEDLPDLVDALPVEMLGREGLINA